MNKHNKRMEIEMNQQHLINEFQDYMLNEQTLQRCLIKQKPDPKNIDSRMMNQKEKEKEKEKEIKKEKLIIPKQKDTLFWCFYIMVHGDVAYELLQPINLIVEKKWKIEYIEKIRQNKILLKQHKYATLVHIENQLLNEPRIDLKTFFSLCVLENINLFYINKKTYYELKMNDTTEQNHILRHYHENNSKYGFETADQKILENHKSSLFRIENLDKPLKALSSYKIQELIDFCERIGLDTQNPETKKPKKKQELYESLIQYF